MSVKRKRNVSRAVKFPFDSSHLGLAIHTGKHESERVLDRVCVSMNTE